MFSKGGKTYDGESEYDFYKKRVAPQLESISGVEVIYRDYVGLKGAYKKARDLDCVAVIELHFNFVSNTAVSGFETLSSARPEDEEIADFVLKEIEKYTSTRNRGNKIKKKGQRGALSTEGFDGPNCLLEPFFGSNEKDVLEARKWVPSMVVTLVEKMKEKYEIR